MPSTLTFTQTWLLPPVDQERCLPLDLFFNHNNTRRTHLGLGTKGEGQSQ